MSGGGHTISGAVADAVEEIHKMLGSMEILPGQAIRQEALAARLGLSRAPVREALGILKSEGVLDHERNVGYSVKRLTQSELDQTYLIRRAIETELVLATPPLDDELIAELEEMNIQMEKAGQANDVALLRHLNHQFHFAVFAASGMDLVVKELRRVWAYTDAYRSFYLYDESARNRIVHEHDGILNALREHDMPLVASLLNKHRSQVPLQLALLLAAQPATPRIGL